MMPPTSLPREVVGSTAVGGDRSARAGARRGGGLLGRGLLRGGLLYRRVLWRLSGHGLV